MENYKLTSLVWHKIFDTNNSIKPNPDSYPRDYLVFCTNNIETTNKEGNMSHIQIGKLKLVRKRVNNIKCYEMMAILHSKFGGSSELCGITHWMDLPVNYPCTWLFSIDNVFLKTIKIDNDRYVSYINK